MPAGDVSCRDFNDIGNGIGGIALETDFLVAEHQKFRAIKEIEGRVYEGFMNPELNCTTGRRPQLCKSRGQR